MTDGDADILLIYIEFGPNCRLLVLDAFCVNAVPKQAYDVLIRTHTQIQRRWV